MHRDGLLRGELESRLLFASPAELLLAQPASSETRRLCEHIGEQLGGAAPRLESAPAAKYGRGGRDALSAVLAFYETAPAAPAGSDAAAGAAEASPSAGPAAGSAQGPSASAAALEAVQALPPLVLRALAHLLDYLRPFGLQAVLRLGASFQPWATAQEMRLSANTLRWVAPGTWPRSQHTGWQVPWLGQPPVAPAAGERLAAQAGAAGPGGS